jgi:hypothetical protein
VWESQKEIKKCLIISLSQSLLVSAVSADDKATTDSDCDSDPDSEADG